MSPRKGRLTIEALSLASSIPKSNSLVHQVKFTKDRKIHNCHAFALIVGWLSDWQSDFMVDQRPSRSVRRAVIIDDEPAFVIMLTKMLESFGFEVKVSTDARSIQTYEIRDSDIVFVDALMPHVSGLQVLEQLERQGTKSPIIAMSGNPPSLDQAESLARKLELNIVGVLEKPFRVADVKFILDGL